MGRNLIGYVLRKSEILCPPKLGQKLDGARQESLLKTSVGVNDLVLQSVQF